MLHDVGQKLLSGLAEQWCMTDLSAETVHLTMDGHLAPSQYEELVVVLPILAWHLSCHTIHSAIHADPA